MLLQLGILIPNNPVFLVPKCPIYFKTGVIDKLENDILLVLVGAGQNITSPEPQFVPINNYQNNNKIILHVVDPMLQKPPQDDLNKFIIKFKQINKYNDVYQGTLDQYIEKKIYKNASTKKIIFVCFTVEIKNYPILTDEFSDKYIALDLGHTGNSSNITNDYFTNILNSDFTKISDLCKIWFSFKTKIDDFSYDRNTNINEYIDLAEKYFIEFKNLLSNNNIIQNFYKYILKQTNPFLGALETRKGMLCRVNYLRDPKQHKQPKTNDEINNEFKDMYKFEIGTNFIAYYSTDNINILHNRIKTILEENRDILNSF